MFLVKQIVVPLGPEHFRCNAALELLRLCNDALDDRNVELNPNLFMLINGEIDRSSALDQFSQRPSTLMFDMS
jgi:hypothetical protein